MRDMVWIMGSALLLSGLFIHPDTQGIFPLWIIASAAGIADTMFHELGHSLFAWLFGMPSIPSIFTIFGREHAAGMAVHFERSVAVQIMVLIACAAGCYQLYERFRPFFWPALGFMILIVLLALTPYYEPVVVFMGHGSAMVMGGFFLYRAWLRMDARNGYEWWLNAFLACYMLLHNGVFCARLAFDAHTRAAYSGLTIKGIVHHDFVRLGQDYVAGWSLQGWAIFGLCFALTVALISTFLAWLHNQQSHY